MRTTRVLARATLVGTALASSVGVITASPADAAWDGCYEGQVGYYKQYNGGGHCYGFSGTNRSFGPFDLSDQVLSGKNRGRSGLNARLYPHTDGRGGMALCLPDDDERNNPAAPQGNSNDWGSACRDFYNAWGVYIK